MAPHGSYQSPQRSVRNAISPTSIGSSTVDPFQEVRQLPTKLLMKDDQDSSCETIDDDDNYAGDNDPYRRHVHLLSPQDNHLDDDDFLIHPDEYLNEQHSNDNASYQLERHRRFIRPELRSTSSYNYTPPSSHPPSPRRIAQPELLSVSEKARLFSQLSVPSLPSPYGSRRTTHTRSHSSSSQRSSRRAAPPTTSSSRHPPPMHPLHENNTNIPRRRHHNNNNSTPLPTTKKPPRHRTHSASRDKENTTHHQHRPPPQHAPSQPFPNASSSYSPRTLSYLRDNPAMRHTLPVGDRLRGGGTAFAGRLGTKGCGMQREKRKVLRTWTGGMELVSPGVLCGANAAAGFRFDQAKDKYGDKQRYPLHASPLHNNHTKHRKQHSSIPSQSQTPPPHPPITTSSHRRSISCPAPSAPPLSSPEQSSLHLMDDGTSPTCHDESSLSAVSESTIGAPDDFDLLLRDACHQSVCSMQTPVPPPPLEDVFTMACQSERRVELHSGGVAKDDGEMRHLASKLTDDTDILEDDDDLEEDEMSKMTEESVKVVEHRRQQGRRRKWFRRKKNKSKTEAIQGNKKSKENESLEVVDLYGRGGVVLSTVPVKSYCTCSVM